MALRSFSHSTNTEHLHSVVRLGLALGYRPILLVLVLDPMKRLLKPLLVPGTAEPHRVRQMSFLIQRMVGREAEVLNDRGM